MQTTAEKLQVLGCFHWPCFLSNIRLKRGPSIRHHKQIWKATPTDQHWSQWHLLCTPTKCPALVTTFEEKPHQSMTHSHTLLIQTPPLWGFELNSKLYWDRLCNTASNLTILLNIFCQILFGTFFSIFFLNSLTHLFYVISLNKQHSGSQQLRWEEYKKKHQSKPELRVLLFLERFKAVEGRWACRHGELLRLLSVYKETEIVRH